MRNWLIECLGGHTKAAFEGVLDRALRAEASERRLRAQLQIALQNDHRDPETGRYVKSPEHDAEDA